MKKMIPGGIAFCAGIVAIRAGYYLAGVALIIVGILMLYLVFRNIGTKDETYGSHLEFSEIEGDFNKPEEKPEEDFEGYSDFDKRPLKRSIYEDMRLPLIK